ncbi:MAG: hypothetical protein QOJ65_1915 [Fimbriimonadaceae bacterium]|nr:hypothetical protein [Fimbriimonadaceae bacterium]
MDDRLNSEGIRRDQLTWALRQRRVVGTARRINSCLLCRRIGVNESGLCEVCFSLLNDEESRLAGRWMSGEGPP